MNEVELLFTEILNCNRVDLYLNKDLRLDKDKSSLLSSALRRRVCGEPIHYILGKTEFMGLEFKVNRDVFIPRPETEILVEKAIEIVKGRRSKVEGRRILDIGTGSGCIAISLAKYLSDVKIIATDISEEALEIAKGNAERNRVGDKIKFIKGDIFHLPPSTFHLPPFDLIVSNPPYIPTEEIKSLQPEIKYEPRIALNGGKDGLSFYRKIIKGCPRYLKENGYLIMEMGHGQPEAIQNIVFATKKFKIIEIIKDYRGIERVIVAQWIN